KLRPDEHREHAGEHEVNEHRDEVHVPNNFVVCGRYPLHHRAPQRLAILSKAGDLLKVHFRCCPHCQTPSTACTTADRRAFAGGTSLPLAVIESSPLGDLT